MNGKTITDALAAITTVITDAVNEEAKTLVDPKAPAEAKLAAGRALNALGRVNTTMTKAGDRVAQALKRLDPKPKKKKAKKTTK